jgi:hypothetical protein
MIVHGNREYEVRCYFVHFLMPMFARVVSCAAVSNGSRFPELIEVRALASHCPFWSQTISWDVVCTVGVCAISLWLLEK